ncbi:hypothetical protein AMATHDRAFT_49966 [Amanita thiersii Skay4041]|uniref:Uncharacterized protein n=1 Tax=Amanita thiersii Skay4041 TaxID=703135 RepID=A0A2A9NJB4_9AGAR|nr:hypothetical protein AMATHDRAFT_49966 [Amanita thiersii Skay4041]
MAPLVVAPNPVEAAPPVEAPRHVDPPRPIETPHSPVRTISLAFSTPVGSSYPAPISWLAASPAHSSRVERELPALPMNPFVPLSEEYLLARAEKTIQHEDVAEVNTQNQGRIRVLISPDGIYRGRRLEKEKESQVREMMTTNTAQPSEVSSCSTDIPMDNLDIPFAGELAGHSSTPGT